MDTVDVQADAAAVAHHVAGWLTERALATPDRFALALSGGSTPKALFELLASEPFRQRFPWDRTHIFFGDERFVPPDHPDSNFRMARLAMLDHVPVPAAQIHAWPTDTTPEECAARYASTLQDFYGAATLDPARPLFDVQFLGLGEDGHTASLFPGTAALDETLAWVTAVRSGHVAQPRLSLTYPALASSGTIVFLAAGAGKTAMLRRVWGGDHALPAARVRAVGRTLWFIDQAAAG